MRKRDRDECQELLAHEKRMREEHYAQEQEARESLQQQVGQAREELAALKKQHEEETAQLRESLGSFDATLRRNTRTELENELSALLAHQQCLHDAEQRNRARTDVRVLAIREHLAALADSL